MVSDKTLPIICVEINFHIKMESRETSKRLFGGKRVQAVWIDTWVAGLHPCGGLNYFTGHFFGVSFDRSF